MHQLFDVRLVQTVLSDQIVLAERTIKIGIQNRPELHCFHGGTESDLLLTREPVIGLS